MKNNLNKFVKVFLAVLMAFSIVACSSSDDSDGDDVTTVTYKDTFTYAIGGEPDMLDPAVASDSVASYVVDQVYYPMFYIGEDGSTEYAACTEYTVSDDGLVYTFTLTEDNYWSDGVQVTADDYVYGMKRALGMGAADSYYSYFIYDYVLNAKAHSDAMDDVADMDDVGIVALDDFTIEITLEQPCAYFVSLMTAGVFYPLREEYATEHDSTWAEDPTVPTNGAYHYVSIDRASEITMTKNEYFPYADQVVTENLVCLVMADADAQLIAFQAGEIDFATNVNTEVCTIYEGQEELVISDSVINYYIQFNCFSDDCEALQDVRVRRAIQLGIDRSNIVTALDAGDVYYELYGYVPMGFAGVDGDFRTEIDESDPYIYTDKEEAKALLAEAGYDEDNPLKLTYYYNQAAMHDTVAEVLVSELAEINIELTLQTGEIRTFFDDRSNGIFELARGAMSADYMDVSTYLDMAASWSQDVVTWGDDTVDEMITYSRTITDETERLEYLHELEEYIVEEMAYTCPLFGYKQIVLAKAGTTGYTSSPQGNNKFWYVAVPED